MVTREQIMGWMVEDGGSVLYDTKNPGVFTGYVTFTPDRAKSALENNTHNRKMGTGKQFPILKNVMQNGLWDANVSKINFEADGTLSDGQNRLYTGMHSQTTFRCLVTWGIDRTAQLVTDRRGARVLSDDLHIAGVKSANRVSAITKVYYFREEKGYEVKTIINKGSVLVSAPDTVLFRYFFDNAEKIKAGQLLVDRVMDSVRDLKISASTMNVLVIEFDKISTHDAAVFWDRLSTGITPAENDPVIMLRKRLSENARAGANKMPRPVEAALIIKAWNFYMSGETPKLLKYTAGGANPEPFPEIYNPYI